MTRSRGGFTVVRIESKAAMQKLVAQLQPIQDPAEQPLYQPAGRVSPLAVAAAQLRGRFEERGDAFHLDGRPVNLAAVMRETNRLLAAQDLAQVPGPPSWAWHGR